MRAICAERLFSVQRLPRRQRVRWRPLLSVRRTDKLQARGPEPNCMELFARLSLIGDTGALRTPTLRSRRP